MGNCPPHSVCHLDLHHRQRRVGPVAGITHTIHIFVCLVTSAFKQLSHAFPTPSSSPSVWSRCFIRAIVCFVIDPIIISIRRRRWPDHPWARSFLRLEPAYHYLGNLPGGVGRVLHPDRRRTDHMGSSTAPPVGVGDSARPPVAIVAPPVTAVIPPIIAEPAVVAVISGDVSSVQPSKQSDTDGGAKLW